MISSNSIDELIFKSIDNLNLAFNSKHKLLLNSDFLGKNRELDSEKIVFFILDLEKNLNNQLDLTSLLFNEDHQMNTFEDLKNIILEKIK